MKKYEIPTFDFYNLSQSDVITTSSMSSETPEKEPGVELPDVIFPRG